MKQFFSSKADRIVLFHLVVLMFDESSLLRTSSLRKCTFLRKLQTKIEGQNTQDLVELQPIGSLSSIKVRDSKGFDSSFYGASSCFVLFNQKFCEKFIVFSIM